MSAWDPRQVKLFAKQIAESQEGKAWPVLGPTLRAAVISHRVLMIVFGQLGHVTETFCIDDVRELRIMIEERLAKHHNMKTHA